MEKDSTKAASTTPRASASKAALLQRELLARGSRGASSAPAPTVAAVKAPGKAPLKAASATGPRGRKSEAASAERQTRQRHQQETRSQMLERLSNPLISLHEASVLLRVCSATVRRLSNDGDLPHKRTDGGQRRFHLRDVLRLLAEREQKRSPSSRAVLRPASPAPVTRTSPGNHSASHLAARAEEHSDAARAVEARERLATARARVLEARLAAQEHLGANGSTLPSAPEARSVQPSGEPRRALNPLRLGVGRVLSPGPATGAQNSAPASVPQPDDEGRVPRPAQARDQKSAKDGAA